YHLCQIKLLECHHNCFHLYIAYSFAPPYLVLLNAVEKRYLYKYPLLEHLVSERFTSELLSCSLHENRTPIFIQGRNSFSYYTIATCSQTVIPCSFINYFVNKYGSHAQQ